MNTTVGISNRHVHLTIDSYNKLFNNEPLNIVKELSQPGQFASDKKVILKTEKDIIENVRILGPLRDYDQVEISKTDAIKLGINPPIRNSGDVNNSEKITLIGPSGELELQSGCIIAARHIHISPKQVIDFGLANKEVVKVKFNGEKGGIIDNVYLKPTEDSFFELHVDTDDGNAHMINQGDTCSIIMDDEF